MMEDEWLKLRLRFGSREALRRIYEKHLDRLLSLAVALLNDANAAEDVVHDVFVALAKSSENLRLRKSLRGYLATAVVNRARDVFRSRHGTRTAVDDTDLPDVRSRGPHESVVYGEQTQLLIQALAKLPPEQREVVVFRARCNMGFKDVARLQGGSLSTVQGRYRYGITKLRSLLNGELKDETDR
jgi:RNA polymerase sigma factor (sigma-70 family)